MAKRWRKKAAWGVEEDEGGRRQSFCPAAVLEAAPPLDPKSSGVLRHFYVKNRPK